MKKCMPLNRFETFHADWKTSRASDVFGENTEKDFPELPVLSASQEYGMIKRDDVGINMQYSKKNVSSYKRVLPGQFVIHLRSFKDKIV